MKAGPPIPVLSVRGVGTPPQPPHPSCPYPSPKLLQRHRVPGDAVVGTMAVQFPAEDLMLDLHGKVPMNSAPFPDRVQASTQAGCHRLPEDCPVALPRLRPEVGETEEISSDRSRLERTVRQASGPTAPGSGVHTRSDAPTPSDVSLGFRVCRLLPSAE